MFTLIIPLFAVAVVPAAAKDTCPGETTYEMNECYAKQLERADHRLERYYQAAIARHTDEKGKSDIVAKGIQASQAAFATYRRIECDTVLEDWKDGTIRGVMTLGCRIRLTNERTQTVWSNWLQYMDDTPPILPEPKPAE